MELPVLVLGLALLPFLLPLTMALVLRRQGQRRAAVVFVAMPLALAAAPWVLAAILTSGDPDPSACTVFPVWAVALFLTVPAGLVAFLAGLVATGFVIQRATARAHRCALVDR